MKQVTKVKWFDAKKGYGFLEHPDGEADIFVHYTSVQTEARFRTLTPGETVEFELSDGPKGIHARDVISLAPAPDHEPSERFEAPRHQETLDVSPDAPSLHPSQQLGA
jgi:CspA family cold shock protein